MVRPISARRVVVRDPRGASPGFRHFPFRNRVCPRWRAPHGDLADDHASADPGNCRVKEVSSRVAVTVIAGDGLRASYARNRLIEQSQNRLARNE